MLQILLLSVYYVQCLILTATLTCDDHWTFNSGMCFQFNDTKHDYLTAQESCKSQGGDLATVNTNSMHSFVISKF